MFFENTVEAVKTKGKEKSVGKESWQYFVQVCCLVCQNLQNENERVEFLPWIDILPLYFLKRIAKL